MFPLNWSAHKGLIVIYGECKLFNIANMEYSL